MHHSISNLCIGLAFMLGIFIVIPQTTHAADTSAVCQSVYEEIIPLRVPDFDQAAQWKKTVGKNGMDRLRAILPVVDGGWIGVGTSIQYDEKKGLSSPEGIIIRADKTGRIVINQSIPIAHLKNVIDAALVKDKIIVLSHVHDKDDTITLSFLNGAGQVLNHETIHDPDNHLVPQSFTTLDKGFVIAVEATPKKKSTAPYTILLWVNQDGKIITSKEYLPGVRNKPDFIGQSPDGGLILTGRVTIDGHRDAGWVARLSATGDIIYQRPYARGAVATLRRAVAMDDGGMVVVGDAIPAAKGSKAAWVMRLDKEGNPVWQKFLTGDYAYAGLDVMRLEDGRINVLTAGTPSDAGGRQFARILTLNAAGVMMGDESFIEGSNAVPSRIAQMNGKRALAGMAETGFTKKDIADELKRIGYDAWMVALSSLADYNDPCAPKTPSQLDDDE